MSQSAPFAAALGLLILLGVMEGIALLFGASAAQWLDGTLAHEPPDGFLGWLHLGRAPLLVLLAIFLTAFALTGLISNALSVSLLGHALPWPISVPIAVLVSLPIVRGLGQRLARLVPREESYAVSFTTLVGRVASMLGNARRGYPAQAKVDDGHGHTLYLMVEPEEHGEDLPMGSDVLLVRQIHGSRFAAIPNPRPDLLV